VHGCTTAHFLFHVIYATLNKGSSATFNQPTAQLFTLEGHNS